MVGDSHYEGYDRNQVNRQKLNEVMDALQKVNEDVNIIFNITAILTQHLRYHQIYTMSTLNLPTSWTALCT